MNSEAVGESCYVQGKWPWQALRGNREDRGEEREQEDRTEGCTKDDHLKVYFISFKGQ